MENPDGRDIWRKILEVGAENLFGWFGSIAGMRQNVLEGKLQTICTLKSFSGGEFSNFQLETAL